MGFLTRFKHREPSVPSSQSAALAVDKKSIVAEHSRDDGAESILSQDRRLSDTRLSAVTSPAMSAQSRISASNGGQRHRAVTDPIYAQSLTSSGSPYGATSYGKPWPTATPQANAQHASEPHTPLPPPPSAANGDFTVFANGALQPRGLHLALTQSRHTSAHSSSTHIVTKDEDDDYGEGEDVPHRFGSLQSSFKIRTPLAHEFDDGSSAEEILDEDTGCMTEDESALLDHVLGLTREHKDITSPPSTSSDIEVIRLPHSFSQPSLVRPFDCETSTNFGRASDESSETSRAENAKSIADKREQQAALPESSGRKKWHNGFLRSSRRPQTADAPKSVRLQSTDLTERRRLASFKSGLKNQLRSAESLVSMNPTSVREGKHKRQMTLGNAEQQFDWCKWPSAADSDSVITAYAAPANVGLPRSPSQSSLHGPSDDEEELLKMPQTRLRRMSSTASQAFTAGLKQARSRGGTMTSLLQELVHAQAAEDNAHSASVKQDEPSIRNDREEIVAKFLHRPSYDAIIQQLSTTKDNLTSPSSSSSKEASVPFKRTSYGISRASFDANLIKLGPTRLGGLAPSDMPGRITIVCQEVKSQAFNVARMRVEKQHKRRAGRPNTSQGQVQPTNADLEEATSTLEQKVEEQMRINIMDGVCQTIEYHDIHLAAAFIEARRQMSLSVTPWRLHGMFHLTDVQPVRHHAKQRMYDEWPRMSEASDAGQSSVSRQTTCEIASLTPAPRKKRISSTSPMNRRRYGSTSATSDAAVAEYENIRRQAALNGSPASVKQELTPAQDVKTLRPTPLPLSAAIRKSQDGEDSESIIQQQQQQRDVSLDEERTDSSDTTSRRDSTTTNTCLPLTPPANSTGFSSVSASTVQSIPMSWTDDALKTSTDYPQASVVLTLPTPSSPTVDPHGLLSPAAAAAAATASATGMKLQVLTPESFKSRPSLPARPASRSRRSDSLTRRQQREADSMPVAVASFDTHHQNILFP